MGMENLEEENASSSTSSSSTTGNWPSTEAHDLACSTERIRYSDALKEEKWKHAGRNLGSETNLDLYSEREGIGEVNLGGIPTVNHVVACESQESQETNRQNHLHRYPVKDSATMPCENINYTNKYDNEPVVDCTLSISPAGQTSLGNEMLSSPVSPSVANVTDSMQSSCATVSSGISLYHSPKRERERINKHI